MSHNNRGRGGRGGAFRTDTDISRQKPRAGERELQPWQPDSSSGDALDGGLGDDETFGPTTGKGGGGEGWDQFATNAALFGATTTYSEDLYTTRLDRTKQGFKAREREAERLAREIEGQVSSNVHVAEERGQVVPQGEGWDEEDRYSGVQRRAGAYVPPGARGGKVVGKEAGKDVEDKGIPADQSVHDLATHDSGNAKAPQEPLKPSQEPLKPSQEPLKPSPAKDTLKVSPAKPTPSPGSAAPSDITSTMREFAETERSKIAQAKADMHKTERERRLADLVNFGKTFKVPGTKPKDLQGVLAGSSTHEKKEEKTAPKPPAAAAAPAKPQPSNGHRPPLASGTHAAKPRISMRIPEIPPFKGASRSSAAAQQQPPKLVVPPTADVPVPGIAAPGQGKEGKAPGGQGGLNPAAAAFAFKPNPAASTFRPGNVPAVPGVNGPGQALPPIATTMAPPPIPGIVTPLNGPVPPPHLQPVVRNPFFINPPRRVLGVNLRDEFNPMRSRRAGRPEDTPLVWQYSGRRVLQGVHHHMHPSGMYNLHMNGVHPNLGPPPANVPAGPQGGMPGPPMQQHPAHVVGSGMPPPMGLPVAQQQQKQGQQPPPNGMSPAAGSGMALEDERFSPIPHQPGGVTFQPGSAGAAGGPGMGPAGGFNGYRGPHQQQMQHMGQPGMFAQYPGNGGVFMGNPMMQGMPYNPQMMGNGPMRPVYYPQPGMTSHPTSPMPHALTPQMMSPRPPP